VCSWDYDVVDVGNRNTRTGQVSENGVNVSLKYAWRIREAKRDFQELVLAIVSYKGCELAAFFIDIDVEKSVFEVQRAEYMGILQKQFLEMFVRTRCSSVHSYSSFSLAFSTRRLYTYTRHYICIWQITVVVVASFSHTRTSFFKFFLVFHSFCRFKSFLRHTFRRFTFHFSRRLSPNICGIGFSDLNEKSH